MDSKKTTNTPHVLIIHGVLMHAFEMFYLAKQLRKEGFIVHAISYQSILKTPSANATILHKKILQLNIDKLHIVAHSLGGIVTAHLLEKFDDIPKGNIVMLGTPIKGSWFAKKLQQWPFIKNILANSMEKGLSGENIPEWKSARPWGMIAGQANFGLATVAGGLPREGDGTVMLEETYHDKITSHITLPISHTGLLFSKEVAKLTSCFLNENNFGNGKNKL